MSKIKIKTKKTRRTVQTVPLCDVYTPRASDLVVVAKSCDIDFLTLRNVHGLLELDFRSTFGGSLTLVFVVALRSIIARGIDDFRDTPSYGLRIPDVVFEEVGFFVGKEEKSVDGVLYNVSGLEKSCGPGVTMASELFIEGFDPFGCLVSSPIDEGIDG
jgi:hypothetical protein